MLYFNDWKELPYHSENNSVNWKMNHLFPVLRERHIFRPCLFQNFVQTFAVPVLIFLHLADIRNRKYRAVGNRKYEQLNRNYSNLKLCFGLLLVEGTESKCWTWRNAHNQWRQSSIPCSPSIIGMRFHIQDYKET